MTNVKTCILSTKIVLTCLVLFECVLFLVVADAKIQLKIQPGNSIMPAEQIAEFALAMTNIAACASMLVQWRGLMGS